MESQTQKTPVGWMIASFVFSLLALLFFPPILGAIAIFCGYKVYTQNKRMGVVCMSIAAVALVAGVIIGAVIGASMALQAQ